MALCPRPVELQGSAMPGVVVVDLPVDQQVVIWHVSVGDGLESTMSGAWLLPADDDRMRGLMSGRVLVSTTKAATVVGPGADLADLAAAVDLEIRRLDGAFTRHVGALPSSRRGLVRPTWPTVPAAPRPEFAGDPLASTALTLARWASDLLAVWADVEQQRLSRPFLVEVGGAEPREYPPGWPETAVTTDGETAA
jgi:hypothetical protein